MAIFSEISLLQKLAQIDNFAFLESAQIIPILLLREHNMYLSLSLKYDHCLALSLAHFPFVNGAKANQAQELSKWIHVFFRHQPNQDDI